MFEFIRTYQLDIMLALTAACLTLSCLLFMTGFLSKRRKYILIFMEFVAAFLLFSDRMAYVYAGMEDRTGFIMVRVSNFCVFFFTALIVFGFNQFIKDLITNECGMETIPGRISFVTIASVLEMVLVIISQFTGFFYYFDAANHYHRGPGFLLCYVIPVVCPLLQYSVIRKCRGKLSRPIYTSLVLYIFVPIIMGIIQIFAYGISIVNMSMVLVSISLYFFTYLDINETVKRVHKLDIAELKEEKKSIRRLFEQTAEAFVSAMEKKNGGSEGNAKRTADYARQIAERAGKNKEEQEEIYYAALLHSVGISGLPDSVKGKTKSLREEEVREIESIITVAEAFVAYVYGNRDREPLPYPAARERILEESGVLFEPVFAGFMVNIMDEEFTERAKESKSFTYGDFDCGNYRDRVSSGIPVMNEVTNIYFTSVPCEQDDKSFHEPSIIIFDSFDGQVHDSRKEVENFQYTEYGEAWFDGRFITTAARNMEGSFKEGGDGEGENNKYRISVSRFEDRMKAVLSSEAGEAEFILALPGSTKSAYVSLTGENCSISGIEVIKTAEKAGDDDIRKIVKDVNYTDRMESDLPNIRIDSFHSSFTKGIRVENALRFTFHTMSLPGSTLIWHCPHVMLYYSADKEIHGKDYREYAQIKLNGEISADRDIVENRFRLKKNDNFQGWEVWKEKNQQGMEITVSLIRKRNKISFTTENLGVSIKNTTTILDGTTEIYAALTGDGIALTDIRIR